MGKRIGTSCRNLEYQTGSFTIEIIVSYKSNPSKVGERVINTTIMLKLV